MKTILSILIMTFGGFCVVAQDPQQEINEQVWIPFIKAFGDRDTDAFMDLHSADVVRAPRDARVVWNWNEYHASQLAWNDKGKNSPTTVSLDLRFTERLAGKELAVEVGIYKTTYTTPTGESRSSYGRFHAVLRKENGTWKILVDTDSSEGGSIGEEEFLAASPMQ